MAENKKRILFVDDEIRILDGIRRMLHCMRHEWELEFATSGAQALDMLQEKPFDVIVSDMRMPAMTGDELLREVRKRYPRVVRVALSGQTSKESVLRSVGPIHQYLPKPCDAEILKSTLARTYQMRSLLQVEKLQEMICQMESLPSLSSMYSELMQELQSPNASLKAVGRIVAKDLGMSTKLLQLVNSAFFGIRGHICEPEQAVTLLGLDTIKALALSVRVFAQFEPTDLPGFTVEGLWQHSTAVATLAKRIIQTENRQPKEADDAFLAGMLHDVGKLVYAAKAPAEFADALHRARQDNIAFTQAEMQTIGATHAQVGAYLLGLWGFSDPVIQALLFHHNPNDSRTSALTILTAVHVANALVSRSDGCSAHDCRIDEEYLAGLKLTDRLDRWQQLSADAVPAGAEP